MNRNLAATAGREPTACPASAGWQWIREAFGLVGAKPGFWISSFLLTMVLMVGLSLIPILGQIVSLLVSPFLIAGFANAARRQATGSGPALDDLLIGFRERPGTLVAIALIYFAVVLAVVLIVFAVMFATLGGGMMASGGELDPAVLSQSWPLLAIVWLLALALMLPLIMAYWFAPILAVFDGLDAIPAMKTSFFGCLRNILPFLVYGLAMIPLAIIAAIPLFLGFLVLFPVLFATYFTSWRAVFGER